MDFIIANQAPSDCVPPEADPSPCTLFKLILLHPFHGSFNAGLVMVGQPDVQCSINIKREQHLHITVNL